MSRSMCFGNVVVAERGNVVQLTLNMHAGGKHPHALFTPSEIPKLCEVLMGFAAKPKTVVPQEDDDEEVEDIL